MKVYEFQSLFNYDIQIDLFDASTDELIDTFEKESAISLEFQECTIDHVVPNWHNQIFEIYIFLTN